MSGVAPWLVPFFLPNCLSEPVTPTEAREGFVNLITCSFVDKAAKVLDSIVFTNIVIQRSELNQLAHEGDGSINTHVLVADDGFSHSLSLVMRRSKGFQHLHGLDAAVDVEGHASSGEVCFSSSDIVEQTRKCPSDGRKGGGMFRKKSLRDDVS